MKILIIGTAFTVVWEKVVLQDKPDAGAFTFQVTLYQNGDIVFVYSVIPLMVEHIEDTAHPVKVGLSDAYIMDRIVFCEYLILFYFKDFIIINNNKTIIKLFFFCLQLCAGKQFMNIIA